MTVDDAGQGVEFCFSDILIFKPPSLHRLWFVRTNGILLSDCYVLAWGPMLLRALLDLLLPTTFEVSARLHCPPGTDAETKT